MWPSASGTAGAKAAGNAEARPATPPCVPTSNADREQSKTDAGVRTVDVQPELREELVAWRAVSPLTGPDGLVVPTRTGAPQNRHNLRQRVLLMAVERANARLVGAGPRRCRRV